MDSTPHSTPHSTPRRTPDDDVHWNLRDHDKLTEIATKLDQMSITVEKWPSFVTEARHLVAEDRLKLDVRLDRIESALIALQSRANEQNGAVGLGRVLGPAAWSLLGGIGGYVMHRGGLI